MTALPCVGHADLYDLALFEEDAAPDIRAKAVRQAAAQCGSCPSPCAQKVTVDSTPQPLVLLPINWMPPAREGRPEPEQPTFVKRRTRQPDPGIGRDYVRPAQRPAAWARMAAGLAAQGQTTAQIACALCVTESTVAQLLGVERAAA